jgi:hypothetical protein
MPLVTVLAKATTAAAANERISARWGLKRWLPAQAVRTAATMPR